MVLQVNNTDAEGRLTLADALVYACNQGVDKVLFQRFFDLLIHSFCWFFSQVSTCELQYLQVVDLATLTGACIIALGTSMAGT